MVILKSTIPLRKFKKISNVQNADLIQKMMAIFVGKVKKNPEIPKWKNGFFLQVNLVDIQIVQNLIVNT